MSKASPNNQKMQGLQVPTGLNWWVFFWANVVFIIYGSLFPFNFLSEAKPFTEFYANWQMFRNLPDASDNFLLFVPLGIGFDACFQGRSKRVLAGLTIWLLLGVVIQLTQLYLPTRTAAVSDALWNAVGMLFGVLAFKRGRLVIDRLQRSSTWPQDGYAMLLVVLWFCYESFPFVPTLDVGELREHIKSAVIAPPFELMRLTQHALAAALAGVAMMRANWLQPRWLNVLILGSFAVFLEIFVPYGSLRRETLIGIVGGLILGYGIEAFKPRRTQMVVLAVAFSALLITILTPYRGQAPGSTFTFTPFADIFWWGLTVDVSPSAFEALAIGTLFWASSLQDGSVSMPRWGWTGAIFALLVVLEVLRVYVVGYRGDTTLMVMALILASFLVSTSKHGQNTAVVPGDQPTATTPAKLRCLAPYQSHLISVGLLVAVIAVLFHLPGLPYNVRALLGPGIGGIISAFAVGITAYGMANGAFLLTVFEKRKRAMLFPALLVAHGILTWYLLRYSVPSKSLLDIVGTPSMGWPGELELIGRYVALHMAIMVQIVGAVLLVRTILQPTELANFLYWVLLSAFSAAPLYWVIVQWAVTDNLTELMAGDASFLAGSALAAAIFLTCLASSALSAALSLGKPAWRLIVLALTALAGATWFYWVGTEHTLVKYGKVFSAWQFLLSADRAHYAQGTALALRYAVALLLTCISLAAMQWPSWRWSLRTLPVHERRLT